MTFAELVGYVHRVIGVFKGSPDLPFTVHDVTLHMLRQLKNAPGHVASFSIYDPVSQLFPDMLVELVQVRAAA